MVAQLCAALLLGAAGCSCCRLLALPQSGGYSAALMFTVKVKVSMASVSHERL